LLNHRPVIALSEMDHGNGPRKNVQRYRNPGKMGLGLVTIGRNFGKIHALSRLRRAIKWCVTVIRV
jgi:hypothetical protein